MSEVEYSESPYRFPIIFTFILALFAGLLPQNIFATISTLVQVKF